MPHIYETLVSALRGHWKAHAEAYPQKFILSSSQHKDLVESIASVRKGISSTATSDPMSSWARSSRSEMGRPGSWLRWTA